jgi:predicted PurR-regulated permease PerM
MLGFDTRAARAAWTVFLVGLLLAIVFLIRRVLLVFVLAILFAYLLSPLVDAVDRFIRWPRSRAYSLAIVYCLLIAALGLFGMFIGNRAAEEGANLAQGFPKLTQNLERTLEEPGAPWLQPIKRYVLEQLRERAQSFSTVVLPLLQKAAGHVVALLSSVVTIVLIPILAFFFLKDGRELKEHVLLLISPERRVLWEDIFADVHTLLGKFIRALVILGLSTLTVYSIFFSIAGVPYGVLLGAVAGMLEFIPIFGPLAAAIAIVLVAAFSGYGHIILMLAFLAAYRIFQDYILNPNLMGSGVALHPLLVVFGALAGEEIAGVPGMFLSVPALATLRVIYVRIRKARVAPSPDALSVLP